MSPMTDMARATIEPTIYENILKAPTKSGPHGRASGLIKQAVEKSGNSLTAPPRRGNIETILMSETLEAFIERVTFHKERRSIDASIEG